MCCDEIVEEVRKIRQANAERFEHDLDAIVADFKKREGEGDYRVVSLPPRRPESVDKPSR